MIELGKENVERNYNTPEAHWWIAKAYFAKEMWEESLFHFTESARLDPAHQKDQIDPFIEAIQKKLKQ